MGWIDEWLMMRMRMRLSWKDWREEAVMYIRYMHAYEGGGIKDFDMYFACPMTRSVAMYPIFHPNRLQQAL